MTVESGSNCHHVTVILLFEVSPNIKGGIEMAEISSYKCRDCGGTLQFSSRKQKLVCSSCGAEYDVSEFEEAAGEGSKASDYKPKEDQWNVEEEGLVVYECKNCGGEVIGDKNMASTKCPYCDNPIVISSKF